MPRTTTRKKCGTGRETEELQYRFVRRDLILLDADANVVVDILKDAIPYSSRRERCAYPERQEVERSRRNAWRDVSGQRHHRALSRFHGSPASDSLRARSIPDPLEAALSTRASGSGLWRIRR
jgi:hypothetical protein